MVQSNLSSQKQELYTYACYCLYIPGMLEFSVHGHACASRDIAAQLVCYASTNS